MAVIVVLAGKVLYTTESAKDVTDKWESGCDPIIVTDTEFNARVHISRNAISFWY